MKDEWVKDYQSGMSTHAVADKHSADQGAVWRHLTQAGVIRTKGLHVELLRERKDEVIESYLQYRSMKAVAVQFDVSATSVRNMLIEWGIPRRQTRKGSERLKAIDVSVGYIGPALADLPDEILTALVSEARARGKSIAQVLEDDWEPE